MNSLDYRYQALLKQVLEQGFFKEDRTGVGCYSYAGAEIRHDMSEGFPLLTVRKIPFKSVRVELEGFIKGINSKKWYQERGCKFWDEWCNPQKEKYSNDPETKSKMAAEDDLGIIYGNNWRNFHDPSAYYFEDNDPENWLYPYREEFAGKKIDQFKILVDTLKSNPESRRMMVYAWNPLALDHAALPACHDSWQVIVTGNKLNLLWRQRSVDAVLGLPANIASYGTLLHLLAKESGLEEGTLIGHLGDVHVYKNAVDAAEEYITRFPFELPQVNTENFKSIFDWEYKDTKAINYNAFDRIKVEVAV